MDAELKDLKETLSNIEGARPFDQLTTTDVINARPEVAKTIEEMLKKGKWSLPGYDEKFGSMYRKTCDALTLSRPGSCLKHRSIAVDQIDQHAALRQSGVSARDVWPVTSARGNLSFCYLQRKGYVATEKCPVRSRGLGPWPCTAALPGRLRGGCDALSRAMCHVACGGAAGGAVHHWLSA